MEETAHQPACYLDRESPIRRLPQLVFAASQAWRHGGGEAQLGMAALPKALGAKCSVCSFALSGAELLALADIRGGNQTSAMLKRLRAGQCACDGCPSTHYRLLFFDVPPVNWEFLLAEYRATQTPEPQIAPAQRRPIRIQIPLHVLGRFAAVTGICLLSWVGWRWYNGENIPVVRQPRHFQVTPGPDAVRYHAN